MNAEEPLTRRSAVALLATWLDRTGRAGRRLPVFSQAAWTTLLQEAVSHGVHLVLYFDWCLAGPTPANLPSYVSRFLAREYAANTQRNQLLRVELNALLQAGAAQQVSFLPFKGARIISDPRFYPTASVRPLADLDLLVRPEELAAARRALTSLGYVEERPTTWKHLTFVKPDNMRVVSLSAGDPRNPRRVEVHTQLVEDFLGLRLDLTGLAWPASEGRNGAGGEPHGSMPPLLLFTHVAAHTGQDVWERKARLIQLVDLARIVPHLAPGERQILAGAAAADPLFAEPRLLLPSLLLLERVFPGCLPAGLCETLAGRVRPGLVAWLRRTPLADVSLSNTEPRRLHDNVRWTQTPREYLSALRRLVLPDRYGLLAHQAPRLVYSRYYVLAYPLHLLLLGSWFLQRLRRGGRRRPLAQHERMQNALALAIRQEAAGE